MMNMFEALPETFDEKKITFNDLNNCEICYIKFTALNRKHHCRKCGKTVCNKCSNNQRPLSK